MLHRTQTLRGLRAACPGPAPRVAALAAAAFALALAFGGAALGAAAARAADGFLSVIEDLPLAPGLAEIPGEAVVFDSPAGRIVETMARGEATAVSVAAFYRETLPQLGWQAVGETAFRREGEHLSFEFAGGGGAAVTVRIRVRPLTAAQP
jgi:hypothetical protein